MKEKVNITDYANVIVKALPKGILLNTYAGMAEGSGPNELYKEVEF